VPARALERARQAAEAYRSGREELERRSVVRGVLIVVCVVLVFSIARAGMGRVFLPGWWRW
jgi:hypothetical protein